MALAGQNLMDLLQTQLHVKQSEIDSLLEVTKAINYNYSSQDILMLYEQILQFQMGISKLFLFSYDRTWTSILNFGLEAGELEKEAKYIEQIAPLKSLAMIGEDKSFDGFEIIIPVFHKEQPLAYVMCTLPKMESYEVLDDKVTFIQTITNIMVVALENKKLFKRQLEQEAMRKELALAKSVQEMLIPSVMFHNKYMELAAIYKPHQDIGGDYYDYVQVSDDEVVFVIADVSGKGISAAILMANFQATLRTLLTQEIEPVPFIRQLNERLFEITKGDKFITLFIAKYTFSTKKLRYVNAGHNPSVLLRPDGSMEYLKTGCTVLGIFEDLPSIEVSEFTIPEGAVIFNYTDGLTDLQNENKEELSVEHLVSQLPSPFSLNMEELNEKILLEIEKFKGKSSYVDDISILNCRIF